MAVIQIKRGLQEAVTNLVLALGETESTAYRGDRGKAAYDHSQITKGNPHGTTAADVGAAPSSHTKQTASATQLGHVKGGGNVSIGVDGTMSVETVDGGTF